MGRTMLASWRSRKSMTQATCCDSTKTSSPIAPRTLKDLRVRCLGESSANRKLSRNGLLGNEVQGFAKISKSSSYPEVEYQVAFAESSVCDRIAFAPAPRRNRTG